MSRFVFDRDVSQVWIEGSSSVHPIHATATGVTGWIELDASDDGVAAASAFGGEVRVAVDRLASGNALVDRETKRRIDATRHPEIVGTLTAAERIAPDRVAATGDIAFRGQVRSVSGELGVSFEGQRLVVEGTQTFDVREWDLRLPRIGFLRVHPDVVVRIRLVADRAS
jgi:polyisoprenoid-binding protein YceI